MRKAFYRIPVNSFKVFARFIQINVAQPCARSLRATRHVSRAAPETIAEESNAACYVTSCSIANHCAVHTAGCIVHTPLLAPLSILYPLIVLYGVQVKEVHLFFYNLTFELKIILLMARAEKDQRIPG